MKPNLSIAACFCLALVMSTAGCRPKGSAGSAGGPATGELEKAEKALASADVAAAQTPEAPPVPAPAQQIKQAVEAYKGGKLEDAVVRLQTLRATPVMTAQQRMALNDAMAAVMTDIYAQAAKGDPRAVQAVKQYEKMQTQRR